MDVQRIVRTRVSTGDLDAPADLTTAIDDGSVQLVEVVKALGEYLTSTEKVRLQALIFLSSVIKTIKPARINRPATSTLTRFYLSGLDDFESLPTCLSALNILANLSTFDDETTIEVYAAVCEQVNMKAYVQATRHLVYTLFDSLIAKHRSALKGMGTEFIQNYLKMVDGEKDPRNLLLLFAMDRVILLEFDISTLVEDMFDITFCYFPIAFRPPPNDPYGITADDLKVALRGCLSATPLFAKLGIPLFLEKFATASGAAMKDLMLTMAACFPTYGAEAVGERGEELWECIKTEVLYQSDKSIEESSLLALESLIRTIYPTATDVPSGLGHEIIKQCLQILEEPEKSHSLGAIKLLIALLNASPSVGKFAISQTIPQIIRLFNHPSTPSHRVPILWQLTSLLIAASKLYAPKEGATQPGPQTRYYGNERVFELYLESIWDTLREGLRTDGMKDAATRGCVAVIEIPGMWGRDQVEEVVQSMTETVSKGGDGEVRHAVVTGLSSIAKVHPTIIENVTLPRLFHTLPDRAPTLAQTAERNTYRSTLSAISDLCTLPALYQTLVIRVPNKLDTIVSSALASKKDESSDEQYECDVAYAYDLITCLDSTTKRKIAKKDLDTVKRFGDVVLPLWTLVVASVQRRAGGAEARGVGSDRRVIGAVARLTDRMFWELDASAQASAFDSFHSSIVHGQMSVWTKGDKEWTTGSPLRNGASSAEQDLVVLYSSIIQSLKPDTAVPIESPADFLAQMIHWIIHIARDQYHVRAAFELITSFVNKRSSGAMNEALASMLEKLWVSDIQDTGKDGEVRKRALGVYLHLTRALALLRDPLAYTAVERIIDVLKLAYFDPVIVGEAARGLGVVALGKGKSKESHLTAKLLWAQKMWNFALPKLVAGDSEAKGRERLVYLAAFASLLPLVPSSLLMSDLENLLPLILRSLSLSNPSERVNAITTLESILETPDLSASVDKVLHRNAEGLVEGLLKSIVPTEDVELASNGDVRSAALRCLTAITPVIRFEVLGRQKPVVLRSLGAALDDPLRSVRKEAVECRAGWYGYK